MSIIYEALKKIEKVPKDSFSEKNNFLAKRVSKLKKVYFSFLTLGFLGVFFVIFYIFWGEGIYRVSGAGEESKTGGKKGLSQNFIINPEASVKKAIDKVSSGTQTKESYFLEGIIFTEANPFAIVNGQRVYQKDNLGDFKVTKIDRSWIELKNSETGDLKIISIDFR